RDDASNESRDWQWQGRHRGLFYLSLGEITLIRPDPNWTFWPRKCRPTSQRMHQRGRMLQTDVAPAILLQSARPVLPASRLISEAEQIRRLRKELSPIVDVIVRRREQPGGGRDQAAVEVLQIAVVSHIDCRARMHQVGNQKVRVDVLGRGERTDQRI